MPAGWAVPKTRIVTEVPFRFSDQAEGCVSVCFWFPAPFWLVCAGTGSMYLMYPTFGVELLDIAELFLSKGEGAEGGRFVCKCYHFDQ
jgi:hypothetical protein